MHETNVSRPEKRKRTYCWIPTGRLEPGMVLARPVFAGPGKRIILHLAEGSTVTADTIVQLMSQSVECVAVLRNSPLDEPVCAEITRQYEARLREIFGPAPNESCQVLLDALIADGPSLC
ncbi:hypothetical protein [Denitratisoma sp. DHT3]|uniref:hypothetical protein n=1 Tax=Denitratisoma sp. DHT3 TaxID=1981880 RepID=UPI0011A9DD2C|nr:hypothetical protein [Denitratisoma sp. DHT3]